MKQRNLSRLAVVLFVLALVTIFFAGVAAFGVDGFLAGTMVLLAVIAILVAISIY